MGCGTFNDPIQGVWVGELGGRIEFAGQNRFVWQTQGSKAINGYYAVDFKFPYRLDLFTEEKHLKSMITLLNDCSERKILICFSEDNYPLMLDREKGEIFSFQGL
jgi:hypothetical protein